MNGVCPGVTKLSHPPPRVAGASVVGGNGQQIGVLEAALKILHVGRPEREIVLGVAGQGFFVEFEIVTGCHSLCGRGQDLHQPKRTGAANCARLKLAFLPSDSVDQGFINPQTPSGLYAQFRQQGFQLVQAALCGIARHDEGQAVLLMLSGQFHQAGKVIGRLRGCAHGKNKAFGQRRDIHAPQCRGPEFQFFQLGCLQPFLCRRAGEIGFKQLAAQIAQAGLPVKRMGMRRADFERFHRACVLSTGAQGLGQPVVRPVLQPHVLSRRQRALKGFLRGMGQAEAGQGDPALHPFGFRSIIADF